MVSGVIVKNVSLGLSMCAERAAMFPAVAQGAQPVALALAVPDTDGGPTWPHGACLRVGLELGAALHDWGTTPAWPPRRRLRAFGTAPARFMRLAQGPGRRGRILG